MFELQIYLVAFMLAAGTIVVILIWLWSIPEHNGDRSARAV